MADRPYGYGQYFGHYPPGPSNAQQPYHPAPQVGTTPSIQYTAAQSAGAYEYNANRIPGLGLGGAPIASTSSSATSLPPGVPQSWSATTHIPQTKTQFPNHQQTPTSLPQEPSVPHQQPQSNTLEEGELSEDEGKGEGDGEFEDLYEPRVSIGATQGAPENKPAQPSKNLDSRNTSVGDADGSSIYDPHDPHIAHNESPVQSTPNSLQAVGQEYPDDEWEPSYPDRDRSGSYSPYLSPREVHRKISVAKTVSRDNKATDLVESAQPAHQIGLPLPASSLPMPHSSIAASIPRHESRTDGSSPARSSLEPKKAVQDAKKKAQEAILGLWPLKVRYQDYLDEGLDAGVVKRLFKDLGLDVPSPKAAVGLAETTAAKPIPSLNAPIRPQSPPPQKPQALLPDTKRDDQAEKDTPTEVKVPAKSAAEERKDKIARKLAAIAQKTTVAQPPASITSVPTTDPAPAPPPDAAPTSNPVSAPPVAASGPPPVSIPVSTRTEAAVPSGTRSNPVNTPPTAPKTRAENNAILQQKLAALKKQQAQLAADKARVASSESTAASSPAVADLSLPDTSSNSDLIPNTKSATSVQPSLNQKPLAELRGNSKDENIPGLSLSSLVLAQPTQGSNRGLKRPVASDFDNYTSHFEPPKRSRIEEKLIIDVSDDEDVEMDIGSPTEEPSPLLDSNAATGLQALAVLSPLSDGSNRRQQASPSSSSAPTPPIHGTRIDLLHKRIEETKRLIAEAEAKKAAKKVTAQHSPKPMSPTMQQPIKPPEADQGGANDKRALHDRRDRIASYELPRVIAALKEKQDKLKSIVAEAARLELEVQATLDERQKLTVEMECLVEPSATSSEADDPSQQVEADTYQHLALSQPAPLITDPSRSEEITPSDSQQDLQGQHLDEQQPQCKNLPSTGVNGDMGVELSNDEALQAAILTDNTHSMDFEMADADVPAPTADADADDAPVAQGASAVDAPPGFPENADASQVATTQAETITEQISEAVPSDGAAEAGSLNESAPPGMDLLLNEPNVGLNESEPSMRQPVPELPRSEDESYEPRPAQISDFHGARADEQDSTEVMKYLPFPADNSLTNYQGVDDIMEELNPNYTPADQITQELEHTVNEVNSRFFEEPLLLTISQDNHGNLPSLGDLLSYKSPLSYFRAYRFHPKYFEDVPGGLKSMTFSAKIDPMRELCPQALAGETCPNGPNCEYQHFDSMILPDAEIVAELGSADMFAGETRTKFIGGLKRVLSELKTNRVKDFDRITKAIVKYRQDFFGDQTKVLALDSSTL
ncbi:hypothetical protein F4861DRAFT_492402 [Xylaria intraflava]|nr:hypothetical protein F4861DRAFT_492402 [Xylaria intraflava]